MRAIVSLFLVGLCCFMLSAGIPAQPPQAAKPQTLEQMQAEAIKKNDDLKVAEAKVRLAEAALRLAEAELSRDRNRIKNQIATAYADFEACKAGEEEGHSRFKRAQQLRKQNVIAKEALDAAHLTFTKLKSERVAALERLKALVGGGAETPQLKQPDDKKNP